MKLLLDQLNSSEVFASSDNRVHSTFGLKEGLLEDYNEEKTIEWLSENVMASLIY